MAKEWHPHDYVPWSRGRDFAFLGGEDWTPEDSPLDPVAQTAMTVNLLTEDNLPRYHREIATRFGRDGAWGQWVGRWTAEEGRHGIALRDYLVVTRGVDPVELERLRMAHMEAGYDSGDKTALQAVGLRLVPGTRHPRLAPQHRRGDRLPARRAVADPHRDRREPAHGLLPQPGAAALDRDPDATMCAIRDEVVGFQMPGAGMPGFTRNSVVDRQGGHLRPAPAPRRRDLAGAAVLEGVHPRGLRAGGRAGRDELGDSWHAWTRRRRVRRAA